MVRIARDVRPADCCLVPEKREELTTEGGLDVIGNREAVGRVARTLREAEQAVEIVELPFPVGGDFLPSGVSVSYDGVIAFIRAFAGVITGMVVMLVAGVRSDLKVRSILRARLVRPKNHLRVACEGECGMNMLE